MTTRKQFDELTAITAQSDIGLTDEVHVIDGGVDKRSSIRVFLNALIRLMGAGNIDVGAQLFISPAGTALLGAPDSAAIKDIIELPEIVAFAETLLNDASAAEARATLEVVDTERVDWTSDISVVTGGGSVTLNAAGSYGLAIRNGRQVTLLGLVQLTSVSSPTGALQIHGLPWTSKYNAIDFIKKPIVVIVTGGITYKFLAAIAPDSGFITLQAIDSGALLTNLASIAAANMQIYLNLTYEAYTGPALQQNLPDLFPLTASAGAQNEAPGMRYVGATVLEQSGLDSGTLFGEVTGGVDLIFGPDAGSPQWVRNATGGPNGRYACKQHTVAAGSAETGTPQSYVLFPDAPIARLASRQFVKYENEDGDWGGFPQAVKFQRFESGTSSWAGLYFNHGPDTIFPFFDAYQAETAAYIAANFPPEFNAAHPNFVWIDEGFSSEAPDDMPTLGPLSLYGNRWWAVKSCFTVVNEDDVEGALRVELWRSNPDNINALIKTIDFTITGTGDDPIDTVNRNFSGWQDKGTINAGPRAKAITVSVTENGLATDPDLLGVPYDIEEL